MELLLLVVVGLVCLVAGVKFAPTLSKLWSDVKAAEEKAKTIETDLKK